SDGTGVVSSGIHSTPVHAGSDRARHLDLHHVGAAGDSSDSERDPNAILRHNAIRGAWFGNHCIHHHAGVRFVVAGASGSRRSSRRRRLWRSDRRGGRRRGGGFSRARARHDRPRIRSRRNSSRPAQRHDTASCSSFAALSRRDERQPADVADCSAASRLLVPGGGTLGLDLARCSRRRVGGGACAIAGLIAVNYRYFPSLRASMDAGANASVLPAFSVASLVGFGAVVAALPPFAAVRDWVLSIEGGPLVSLAVATNVLAALTGSASGGLTIALDALGNAYMELAARNDIDPALMHRVAVIGSGTLDSLPHNGAVVTLLALCGLTHRESYFDIVMVAIVGAIIALITVIALGSAFGSF